MKQLILNWWIPWSWKTTWTKLTKKGWGDRCFTISKDDVRKELWVTHEPLFSKADEKRVVDTERERVENAMKEEKALIIVDNTHLWLNNKHITYYRELWEKNGYEVTVKEFYCDTEEAIERDSKRPEPVWEAVIRKSVKIAGNKGYPQNPTFVKQVWDKLCVIVDIDWTLAYMKHRRSPYDYKKVEWDSPNPYLRWLLHLLPKNLKVFVVSGRDSECRKETKKWLQDNDIPFDKLLMRKKGDTRKDCIVKKEIFEKNIQWEYKVLWVFDDRDQVVDMWRLELGLPTYQCWYWTF